MKTTIGGDRLGAGKKMEADLRTYNRSSHNMGYIWRSTMSAGTLVPFLSEVALPGDTFSIDLDCDIKTHPTVGPLFGSYKVQLDVFQCPIRLYQAQLHNNKLKIGLDMSKIKLPQIRIESPNLETTDKDNIDNQQINPSSLLSYLNIRGVGKSATDQAVITRDFNAVPILAYWDIYKNYYANKQEEIGYVIHGGGRVEEDLVGTATFERPVGGGTVIYKDANPAPEENCILNDPLNYIALSYLSHVQVDHSRILILTDTGTFRATEIFEDAVETPQSGGVRRVEFFQWRAEFANYEVIGWAWDAESGDWFPSLEPHLYEFDLDNIDDMREDILSKVKDTNPYIIDKQGIEPYSLQLRYNPETGENAKLNSQEGLGIKTYQSDLFNNWMSTEWIDGDTGINAITAVDVSEGSFEINALLLAEKVYTMLNQIAISGGSYDDWLMAVYNEERIKSAESPIYEGGLIKELVFQEVVSNAEAGTDGTEQPLGTLAGKGTMSNKHKGGKLHINVKEPSYLIGIVSLTPRIDYSQGNKWDVNLKTMDDLHKPALDQIGFQDLITEQMAWWESEVDENGVVTVSSAGKQPAWINYMTNVNQVRGNFAVADNEMFMTLNRRYEFSEDGKIKDLTTYIDPVKFNHVFAYTALDAQNFWVQIGLDITARRRMSAKIMPNL